YFGETPLVDIDQAAIDAAALALYPAAAPATRNRSVYTPASAVLKHAGHGFALRRPKGGEGRRLSGWLWPEEAFALFAAAGKLDPELRRLLILLCYTPTRLSEVLATTRRDLRLAENFLFVPDSKNGEPRPVHLPPHVVGELKVQLREATAANRQRLFRLHKS